MQAIIMAAGKGSRLGEMVYDRPKSFAEINGKKLIDINIQMLRAHGIHDISIVTGHHGEMFEKMYGDQPDIRLIYNPFYSFTNVIGSFYMGMHVLGDDFIYMHADTICDPTILEELMQAKGQIVLPVDEKPCDEEAMKVKVVNGQIRYISKKLDATTCDGEFIGIAKLRADIIPVLKEKATLLLRQECFSEYFEAALQKLIDEEKVSVQKIATGGRFWAEIDFPEDYQRAVKEIPACLYQF